MSAHVRASERDASVKQTSDPMSRGLHQATQPLSVLQGTLELALLSARTVDDFKQAIERSLQELQRVTTSFEHLRILAQLQKPASDITTFAASSMVEDVLASLRAHFASAKAEFVFQRNLDGRLDDRNNSGQDRVKMSHSRVSSALKMALSDLLQPLTRGSRLLVSIESEANSVLIQVDAVNHGYHGSQLTETQYGRMTPRREIAQEMTAIAGGELKFNPHSLGLQMRLPKVLLGGVCCEVEKPGEVSSCPA
jgi:hypothetical protein